MTDIIIGIDLGTTNTCVSMAKKTGKKMDYEVLENKIGERTTPSTVAFADEVLIGKDAKNQQVQNPTNTIYGSKRLIGHKFDDEDVQKLFKDCPFKIIGDDEDYPLIEVEREGKKEWYKPEQISSLILGEVKSIVKYKTGEFPTKCVITVPANFSNLQREATKRAAQIAGLNVLNIVNEPTAAAIAFQHVCHFDNGIVLVFDFGGGTLDVSILKVEGAKFQVMAVSGDTALGGEDIDKCIMDEMLKRFKRANPDLNPKSNARAIASLKQKCEEAKCQLAAAYEARIVIPSFCGGKDLDETINRSTFEFICGDIFEKLMDPVDTALEDADLTTDDINHIIMVGGSSHIPCARTIISEHFDERLKPLVAMDPATAIAIGASIICDKMSKGLAFNDMTGIVRKHESADEGYIEIIDVQPMSIGILNGKAGYIPFIIRNKPLPQDKNFMFTNTKNKMKTANIKIYQGEDEEDVNNNIFLGEFKLKDLPPLPKGELLINVRMQVDRGGILNVSASCEQGGGSRTDIKIDVKTRLEGEDMKEAVRIQQQLMAIKDARATYNKLLNEIQTCINSLKSQKKDVAKFEKAYEVFSKSIPNEIENLQKGIDNLEKTLAHLKENDKK